ncbi:unnamed protein product [Durusdinium trenchii]|uniref:Uncharacterized protein n=1 Tax=Durusdinium trenchii TaxID=1381693 RepID=A0ABP0LAT0_9DINO
MPDASQAICIDSEEEAPAPPKKRKHVVQTAPQPVIVSCIDLDDEDKSDKVKHTKCNADAVCLSSDEEAPAIVIPQKPQTALHTLHTVPKEALCEDAVADEFERRAQDLADAALRNLSPAARAARMVKADTSVFWTWLSLLESRGISSRLLPVFVFLGVAERGWFLGQQ